MVEKLRAAQGELEQKNYERALELLLEAWRAEPGSALAELIDHVSRLAGQALPTLRTKPLSLQWAQWEKVAAENRAIDFERLADVPFPRKWMEAASLLNKLQKRGPDPRYSRFVRHLIEQKVIYERRGDVRPGQSSGFFARQYYTLLNLGDRRALPMLEANQHVLSKEALAALRAAPEPAGESLRLVQEMSAKFSAAGAASREESQSAEALLEQIFERPRDLGLRAVYGDLLAARGDPRGEFIAMQLRGKSTPAEERLLKRHVHGWSGPLDSYFANEGRRFEGGFLTGGRLEYSFQPTPEQLSHREWRLITSVTLSSRADHTFLAHPNLANVREVTLWDKELAPFLERTWPFTRLHIFRGTGDVDLSALEAATQFPALRVLGFDFIYPVTEDAVRAWIPRAPVVFRLQRFEASVAKAQPWLKALEDSPLPAVRFGAGSPWTHDFERDARGRLGLMRSTLAPKARAGLEHSSLLELLTNLPVDALTSFKLAKTSAASRVDRAKLEQLLSRFRTLTDVDLS